MSDMIPDDRYGDELDAVEPTIRDLFAAAAMISIMRHRDNMFYPMDDAKWAYQIADAMLAQRNKP